MAVDAQESLLNSIVHVQRFFPPKMQKQMTVMSFGDATDILLMYFEGGYKSKHAWDPRGSLVLSFHLFIWFLRLVL